MKKGARLALLLVVCVVIAGVAQNVLASSVSIGQGTECGDERGATSAADDAGHVFVVWTDYCASHAYLYLQTSSDGGQTFGPVAPLLGSQTFDGGAKAAEDDPSIYVDDSVSPPAVYVAFIATTNFTTRIPENVYVVRSTDDGASFEFLKSGIKIDGITGTAGSCGPVTPGECRRPVVLARGNDVYLAYSYAARSANTRGGRIFADSTNGGSTFVESINTVSPANSSNNRAPIAEGGAIAPNGDAWVVWSDNLARDFTGGADYYVSRTPAGGLTTASTLSGVIYTSPSSVACSASVSPGCTSGWYAPQSDLAIDAAGNLFMAFQDGQSHATAGSPSVIRLGTCALSSASACTLASNWTAQGSTVRVDTKDAGASPNDCGGTVAGNTASCIATFPQVVAGGASHVGVSWADDRDGASCAYNHGCGWKIWYEDSTSGLSGFTSPAIQLNDHLPVSPSSDAGGFKFLDGSFTGLDLNAGCTGGAISVWPESVNRTGGGTNGGDLYVHGLPDAAASPTSLLATATGASTITLTWPASTSGGVTGYDIYRGSGANGDDLSMVTSVGNVTTYPDTGLADGQRYTYAVSAVTGAGQGCQGSRATAALGITRYHLSVATDAAQVPVSNITVSPSSGDGMYDAGTVVTLMAKGPVSAGAGQQFRFDHWTGGPTGSTSTVTVTMSADTTVTAHYVRQWAVSVSASGVSCNVLTTSCETDPTTLATVNGGTTWSAHDLELNGAPTYWVDDGASLTYAFTSTPTTASPADPNRRYRLTGVSGPASGAPVHAASTITGTYVVQRNVTFTQTGVGGDSSGTVVSITDGSGTTNLTASQLPDTRFYDDGGTWTFQSAVAAGSGKRYVLTSGVPGVVGAAQENTTITGTYKTQFALTFSAGGLGPDATGTVVTVDGVPKAPPDLPFADFVDPGTAVTYVYTDPVASTIGGNHYALSGVGGPSSPITVTGASSVSATYTDVQPSQSITFPAVPGHTLGDPDFAVSATASSGLAVAFTASVPCTVSADGSNVHLFGAGSCTLTAHQAGNANWASAPDVARTFAIAKGSQTISFGAVADHPLNAADFSVTATASSGLAVSFTATGTCTVTADGTTVHLTAVGNCTLIAHQAGDANWNAALDVPRSFSISAPTITTTTILVVKPAKVKHGKITTLTATVKAAGHNPTGVVQFTIDGNVVAQGSLTTKGKFVAKVNVGTVRGTHTVVAVYLGGGSFASSQSAPKTLTVT